MTRDFYEGTDASSTLQRHSENHPKIKRLGTVPARFSRLWGSLGLGGMGLSYAAHARCASASHRLNLSSNCTNNV